MNVKPISEKSKQGCGIVAMSIFGSIFFFAGLAFLWMTAISPALRTNSSGDWVETPCTVTFSEVDVNRDGDGTTYRPKVEFEYVVEGKNHVSDAFDFTSLNRSKSRCQEIVKANPVGLQTSCFFDPNKHDDAVIERDYDFSWFACLFPLVFVLIGLGVMLGPIFFRGQKSNSISGAAKAPAAGPNTGLAVSSLTGDNSTMSPSVHPGDIADQMRGEPQKLKPSQKRITTFLVTLGVATFWNGIVGFFIYGIVSEGFGGGFDIIPVLFMIPFVLVGVLLVGGVFYSLAAIFNPTVELALSSGAIGRGESVDLAWQLSGRTSSVRSLKVTVEGEESATYRRGTDTITATNIFCTIQIAEVTDSQDIEFGSETVTIPIDTMHTFAANRNKISWRIVVHGDIPLWPNIKETYEFRVKP
jgi:hypothetical protein